MTPSKPILPLCICGDRLCKIPYGYCHCGCGQKTSVSMATRRRCGYVKGEPRRFVVGHRGNIASKLQLRYGVVDGEPVAYIPLTQGKWAIIDREDLSKVHGRWFCAHGYACQKVSCTMVLMQNVLMPPPAGKITDHKFGRRLDNRKSQLRYVTHQQNMCNRKLNADNKSGYKGVHWVIKSRKWMVLISVCRRRIYVGSFAEDKLVEAAQAYDEAAIKYHGEYASLNFPQEGERAA